MLVKHTINMSIAPTRRNVSSIIQPYIPPGVVVYSDQWTVYSRVGNIDCLIHHTVNHRLHLVDPVTSVHTQNIGVLLEYPPVQNIFQFATDTGYIIDTITPILNLIP